MSYLSIVALIPLAAVVLKSLDSGTDSFWSAITTAPRVNATFTPTGLSGP